MQIAAKYNNSPTKEADISAELHALRSEDADLSSVGTQQAQVRAQPSTKELVLSHK